jgi:hypothetical protein
MQMERMALAWASIWQFLGYVYSLWHLLDGQNNTMERTACLFLFVMSFRLLMSFRFYDEFLFVMTFC